MVHRESADDTPPFTMMVMQWGQYLDHDLTSTPQSRGFNNSVIQCCSEDGRPLGEDQRHPDCSPIQIPDTDPFYSQFNVTCMQFIRCRIYAHTYLHFGRKVFEILLLF
jgi:hypothetical protein